MLYFCQYSLLLLFIIEIDLRYTNIKDIAHLILVTVSRKLSETNGILI